jgi:hypothetical protein
MEAELATGKRKLAIWREAVLHALRPWRLPAALATAFVAGATSHAIVLAPEPAAAQIGTVTRSQQPVIDCPVPEQSADKASIRMLQAESAEEVDSAAVPAE